jgi:2-dehydro-3-deoxy-D-arabinonate dehydratase
MPSGSIVAEDPLYLSPARVYTGSCAVGRAWSPSARFPDASELRISLRVVRNGAGMFSDTVSVTGLCRRPGGVARGVSGVLGFPVGVVRWPGRQTSRRQASSAVAATR